jgi:hypothetical protein
MQERFHSNQDITRRGERLSLGYLARRTRHEVFDLDRGLLGTFRDLLWRPARVTSAFIEGHPARYYSPARYFLIVIALTVLIGSTRAPVLDEGMIRVFQGSGLFADRDHAAAWVADWNALLYTPLMLCLALSLRYFFRARGLNLAEQLVIATYGWSQLLLVGLLSLWLGRGARELGLPPLGTVITLLAPTAWWLYYCAQALRLRSVFDWVRAITAPVAALALYLGMVAVAMGMVGRLLA